jgi:hypothetical protein
MEALLDTLHPRLGMGGRHLTPGIYVDVVAAEQEQPTASSNGVVAASESEKAPQGEFAGLGPLLEEEDDKKVFKAIHKENLAQEKLAKNRSELAKHLGRIRRGIPFSTLTKNEDKATWRAELPPGVTDTPQPIPNKADDLCGKIVSQVLTDPFKPEPKAQDESNDKEKGAADLLKRFLVNDGQEGGTNDSELFRDCLDTSMTRASAVHVWVDEEGDGWRPRQIKAHPQALDANNPLVDQMGQPTSDYVLRYVTADKQFTENPAEADRQWLPKIRRDVLTDANVRTIPAMRGLDPASGVLLLMVEPLVDAKRRFPDLRDMDEAELKPLTDWRPPRAKALVPEAFIGMFKSQGNAEGEGLGANDESLLFWYHRYWPSCYDYPDGAEIAVSGANEGHVLKKATLRDDIEGDDSVTPIVSDVPVSLCKALHDTVRRDPMGMKPLEKFGAANEARAQLLGAVLEDTDRRLHPDIYLPLTSPVQSWQVGQRSNTPIQVLSKDDLPMYEEFAELPRFLPEVINIIDTGMETAAGLGDTAQSLESPNAISGIAKQVVVGQTKVHLAPIHQNFAAFVTRYWRIKAQLAQRKLTVPQQVQYSGVDSAYKQRWFTGADFVGVKDVVIQAGTGTMMSPVEKQQYIGYAQSAMWLDQDEAADAGRSTLSGDLGLSDSPHAEVISRQLAEWMEGPPEEWIPAGPALDPMTQQPMVDEMGQPAMQPASWSPFEPRPTDEDPSVAPHRYKKLRDFIATSDYSSQPPEWKALVDQEYMRMAYAAGIQTVRQQYEAQQQQAAQQQQQASEQLGAEKEGKDADRDAAAGEASANREAQASESAANRAAQTEQTAMKVQGQIASQAAKPQPQGR